MKSRTINLQFKMSSSYNTNSSSSATATTTGNTSSSARKVVKIANFDPENITYGEVRNRDDGTGGKIIPMLYNGAPLEIQFPEMSAPFGVRLNQFDPSAPPKYSLELSIRNDDDGICENALCKLDEKIVMDAMVNSVPWLSKKYSKQSVVEAFYTPIVRRAIDNTTGEVIERFRPRIRIDVPIRNNVFQCGFFDMNAGRIEDDIVKEDGFRGSRIRAIVGVPAVWVAGSRFGLCLKMRQMQINPQSFIRGNVFREDANEGVVTDTNYSQSRAKTQIVNPSQTIENEYCDEIPITGNCDNNIEDGEDYEIDDI